MIVILIKQPQLHLTSVYWTSSLSNSCFTQHLDVNAPRKHIVVFVRSPNQYLYAQRNNKTEWKCITYGSLGCSVVGPKLCVLEKNLALGR